MRIVAEHPNPAVPSTLLTEIWKWKQKGASLNDVVTRLWQKKTVPVGYEEIHTWKPGMFCFCSFFVTSHTLHCPPNSIGVKEDIEDKMRSILAQLEYTCHL